MERAGPRAAGPLRLLGALDARSAPGVARVLAEHPVGEVELDLRGLTLLSAAGVRTLAQAVVSGRERGLAVTLVVAPGSVAARVLRVADPRGELPVVRR
ncbi:STAS domain-containing protein [Actinokineospora bangkokensis]|uniref:STAS domain-containing protein n=1 Tax=Actinokineospora bangkokensis TaxID=1193682 RepID=A0A1Q9LLN9_9PSEU|nr:STAS domain-containing protein [Actinokineospora bangkokensis]OLR92957.1 hypothetical protein BJP25_18480 [Actinokineospora bangkokensis]